MKEPNVGDKVKYTLPYGEVAGETDAKLRGTFVVRTGEVIHIDSRDGVAIVATDTVNGETAKFGEFDHGQAIGVPFADLTTK